MKAAWDMLIVRVGYNVYMFRHVDVGGKNEVSKEIKARISVGNRSYHLFLEIKICETMLRPVVMYGRET
jgi:hypothetical protein